MARREAVDRDSFLPLRHQIGHIGLSWVEHSSPHQKWCCCVFLLSETHTSRENFAGRCHVQAHAQWHHARGEGNGTPLQFSCLANPMDGGAWKAAVHGVAKSRTRLSDFTFTFHFHAWEKEMATHSSVLAWRIPGTGKPGGLPSMGSHRVGHD